MRELLQQLMDACAGRVDYADVRHVHRQVESIGTRNGGVEHAGRAEQEGIGVRVRLGGAWGFAATRGTTRSDAEEALARAIAIAAAQPSAPVTPLAPVEPARGSYRSPAVVDPFSVPFERKLETLFAADAAVGDDQRITVRNGHFHAQVERRTFASTEGALCDQEITECGGGLTVTAAGGDEVQQRSYPASHAGDVSQAGYEHFEGLGLAEHAPRVGEEAVALLTAAACPREETTLILDPGQMSLQLHESVGHAIELDRVLGWEASYAGTSFVTPGDRGRLAYGSPLMNVVADATLAGGLGSFAWDDEGVPGKSTTVVENGRLTGFLSSRETAPLVGLDEPGGCMRADGFARQPIVRMTNVSLLAGEAGTLDDLIAGTDDGIYMETNRSWSIDQRRWGFQFATEIAWEIKNGERTRMLRNPSYGGITPEFWGSLDAVGSQESWRVWGLLNCGKGEPGQFGHVSHGAPPARFTKVRVGVA